MIKAEFAIEILKEYETECLTLPRCINDLSPLEQWLIIKMFEKEKKYNPFEA